MVVLLFMFMVKDPVCSLAYSNTAVDLAKVSSPSPMRAADREDTLIVAVMRDGKVFFGRESIPLENLPAKIRAGINRGAENKVYIKADARAKYASVKEVLDGIHAAGVEKIGILVEQRGPSASNPQ